MNGVDLSSFPGWILMNRPESQVSTMQQVFRSKNNSKYLLNMIFRSFSLVLLVFIILGFAFSLIVQGIILSVFWLAAFWKPAFILLSKFLSFEESVEEYVPMRITWWFAPIALLILCTHAAPTVAGIWFLFKTGFLGQNLIWMIFQ
jgi:hypothetical protein